MPSALWRALLSCSLITAGCQAILGIEDLGSRPDGGTGSVDARPGADARPTTDASPPDAARPEFSFAVLTVNATIPLDGTNVIDVEVQRRGGFDGDVAVAAMSPPNGIQVDPITIPAGQTVAQIPVGARAPLLLGNTISFDLVATADALPARTAAVTNAEITGKPGSPDNSFGVDAMGYAAVSFGSDDDGAFFDLDVLNNGDVLALGWGTGGLGARRFALMRLRANGTPDPNFNGGAMARTGFGTSSGDNAQAYAVGRQVDGRVIAMGGHSAGTSLLPDIALARYSITGAVGDVEFGNFQSGKSRIDLGGDEEVTAGLVLPDSRIVVVGQSSGQLFIARATPTGFIDTTFHAPAGYDIPIPGVQSGAEAVIVDDRGRLLVAGFVEAMGNRDMVVLRYTADGVLDTAFGDGGVVRLGAPVVLERAAGIALRAGGRIVVAGTSNANGNDDFQLRQLMENGAPDLAFGDMGVSTPAMGPGSDVAEDMLLLPDGRVVVVGNTAGGPVVARYTRGGALDAYFGQDGVLNPYVGENGAIHTIEQYSNSKVLIAGGNSGGTPGPGTFGIILRLWM
jgi:uncharacterized delta-60 repeat protein